MPVAPGRSMAKSAILKMHVSEITDEEEVSTSVTLGQNQRVCQCEMAGCNHLVKGETFRTARWFKDLACDCASQQMNDRKRLASLEKAH